jgi:hypothetical protein
MLRRALREHNKGTECTETSDRFCRTRSLTFVFCNRRGNFLLVGRLLASEGGLCSMKLDIYNFTALFYLTKKRNEESDGKTDLNAGPLKKKYTFKNLFYKNC